MMRVWMNEGIAWLLRLVWLQIFAGVRDYPKLLLKVYYKMKNKQTCWSSFGKKKKNYRLESLINIKMYKIWIIFFYVILKINK